MNNEITHFRGRYLSLLERNNWEYASRSNASGVVGIVAVTPGGEIILVEQYRRPIDSRVIELPAGLVGDQADPDESILDAARRELEEETGYRAEEMHDLGEFFSSPGMVSESFTLFLATGLTQVHEGGGVEGEDIILHRVPLAQISEYVAARRAEGFAIDVKMLIALGAGMMNP